MATGDLQTTSIAAIDRPTRERLGHIDLIAPFSYHRPMIDTVGVVADIKPAALLEGDHATVEALAHIEGIYSVALDYPDATGKVISKDPDLAKHLQSLLVDSRILCDEGYIPDDQHREIGRILGYPRTATDYFIERAKHRRTHRRYPNEAWLEAVPLFHRHIAGFIFSPNHYPEEIEEYSAKLAEALRAYAPNTYRSLWNETVGQSAAKRFILP